LVKLVKKYKKIIDIADKQRQPLSLESAAFKREQLHSSGGRHGQQGI
jgi:hypothetical protein